LPYNILHFRRHNVTVLTQTPQLMSNYWDIVPTCYRSYMRLRSRPTALWCFINFVLLLLVLLLLNSHRALAVYMMGTSITTPSWL